MSVEDDAGRPLLSRFRRLRSCETPLLTHWFGGARRLSDARGSGRADYALAKASSPGIVAIVGLKFEARIIAGPSVRAVSRGATEAGLLDAGVIETDRAIISFGVCGGLAPGLPAGSCVVASCILDGTRVWSTDSAWSAHLLRSIPGAVAAPILGVDDPIIEVAEKGRLYRRHGAAAVDTESHVAASIASLHGLPFAAVRVVVDDARCKLLSVALAGRQTDGSISAKAVFRALLESPGELAPLILLAVRANFARATLMRLRPLFVDGLAFPDLATQPTTGDRAPGPAPIDQRPSGERIRASRFRSELG